MSCSFKIGKKISGQYHFVRGHPTVNKSWFTTGLSLTTNGGQTSVTECTSMWAGGGGALYPVIYLQERKFSVPILLRSAFPRSCIKFAFPRARLPKMPGTRERGNAKPGKCAHLCWFPTEQKSWENCILTLKPQTFFSISFFLKIIILSY